MSNYQEWRDRFIARMSIEGLPIHVTRQVLRLAATIDRLAVAQCNGDYPADNGQRETRVCEECGRAWVPAAFRRRPVAALKAAAADNLTISDRICIDCHTEQKLTALMPPGFAVITGGDPRGCTTKITTPSGGGDYSGSDGYGVPVRNS